MTTCGAAGAAFLGAMAGGLISGGIGAALERGDWFDIGWGAMWGMTAGAITAGILGGIGSSLAPQFLGNGVGIIANGKNFIPAMNATIADVANRIFGTASTNLINGIGNGMLAGSVGAGAIGGSFGSSYAPTLSKLSSGGNGDLVETMYSSAANGGDDIQQILDYYGLEINLASSGPVNTHISNNPIEDIFKKIGSLEKPVTEYRLFDIVTKQINGDHAAYDIIEGFIGDHFYKIYQLGYSPGLDKGGYYRIYGGNLGFNPNKSAIGFWLYNSYGEVLLGIEAYSFNKDLYNILKKYKHKYMTK